MNRSCRINFRLTARSLYVPEILHAGGKPQSGLLINSRIAVIFQLKINIFEIVGRTVLFPALKTALATHFSPVPYATILLAVEWWMF
jgi:hypothetical protein